MAGGACSAGQRGGGGGKLERLGGGQIGDRGAEEKAGQHLVLRKRRNACEGDFGPQAGARDADGAGQTLQIGFGREVYRGIGRLFSGEADLFRSDERLVGTACVYMCRLLWSPDT